MLTLFLIVFIIGLIVGIILYEKLSYDCDCDYEFVFGGISVVSGVGALVSLIIIIILIVDIFDGVTIDERIALYEEQNSKIESQISTLVEGYMDYESNTFDKLKDEDVIALISLYPELKADTLVSNQCELYIENNKNIIQLKEEKIRLRPKKFLVYFGK